MSRKDVAVRRGESCVYCGFPTRHWSKTCPAHRDLVPVDAHRLRDDELRWRADEPLDAATVPALHSRADGSS